MCIGTLPPDIGGSTGSIQGDSREFLVTCQANPMPLLRRINFGIVGPIVLHVNMQRCCMMTLLHVNPLSVSL